MANAIATTGSGGSGEILSGPGASSPARDNGTDVLERAIAATQGPPGVPRRSLNRDQKAAIIVRLLAPDPSSIPLADLEDATLARLVRAMAGLSFVDEATVLSVVQEFLGEFDSLALYFQRGLDGATKTLAPHLSDGVTSLLAGPPPPDAEVDPWQRIAALEPTDLAALLDGETAQVCAITLAKLPPVKSAELLQEMGAERARDIALVATQSGVVTEAAVQMIGTTLAARSQEGAQQGALAGDPADRVSQILNFATGTLREDILQGLESADADMADKIRRAMFTFADIPDRVEITDVPKLARAVENETLVTALAGGEKTDKETVEFLLDNLSKRLSEQLAEEVRELGEVKPKDADTAMNALVQGIRDLESRGEISLIQPEE